MKKILSILMSAVLSAAVLSFAPGEIGIVNTESASAVSIFRPRLSEPSYDNSYYFEDNPYYRTGYGMPNCTCYAYGRAYELLGVKPRLSEGDASSWYYNNMETEAYPFGQAPRLGAIACWNGGGSGHVAVVEKIEGDVITLSQSSWGGSFFDTWTGTDLSNIEYGFEGYIYIGDWADGQTVYRERGNRKPVRFSRLKGIAAGECISVESRKIHSNSRQVAVFTQIP